MAQGLITRRGGNAVKLRVAAYSTVSLLPAAARAGDIAIITGTTPGKTNFSGTQPANPASGDLWIRGASNANVSVTLKASPLFVIYPQTAWQYLSGAWAVKPMHVYVGGAWLAAGTLWLFGSGQNAVTMETSAAGGTATLSGSVVVLSTAAGSSPSYAGVRSGSAVDLSGSKRIVATFSVGELDRYRQIAVTTGPAWTSGVVSSVTLGNTTGGMTLTLDTSALSGSYYVHCVTYYPTSPGNTVTYNLAELRVVYSD